MKVRNKYEVLGPTTRLTIKSGKKSLSVIFDTADLESISSHKWRINNYGYPMAINPRFGRGKDRRLVSLARLLCVGYVPAKNICVKFKNCDKTDYRRVNLAVCTRREIAWNMRRSKNNTSGYKGVTRSGKKWVAIIRQQYLGMFDTPEEAALAYNEAAVKYFGVFARLNNVRQ